MKKLGFLVFTLIVFFSTFIEAQRRGDVNYITLANRASTPNFFFEELVVPGENGNPELIFIFRMDNDFLPFKKITVDDDINTPESEEFFSTARLNTEIFKGNASKKDLEDISSVSRDVWADTLLASNYEQTKSKKHFAEGKLVTSLAPGMYNYVLQLNLMEEVNERNSQRRNVRVPDFNSKKTGEIYLLNNESEIADLRLINMGNNVRYAEDYKVLVRIPNYDSSKKYSIDIHKAQINRRDTTNQEKITSITIDNNKVLNRKSLSLKKDESVSLMLTENGSFTYALISIPNKGFENSVYSLSLNDGLSDKPLARKIVRSFWPDIPPSLLNLDIAIDMMKFIVSEDQLKNLKKGNDKEKEKKFRSFWEQRDPTPDTEFNELMTEYYNRVHHAFKEFRTPESPFGQDTDRGEVYIKYGPPTSTDRAFPKKGQVLETWKYPNRTFVFEKGSGFSEFVLLGK